MDGCCARPVSFYVLYKTLDFSPGPARNRPPWKKMLRRDGAGNRNVSATPPIWRVVSLNWRGFAAFLQHGIDEQPEPRSSRAASTDGARSCVVGREDHDRFDERSTRPVVWRRVVLDRGDVPDRGADCVSRPEPD